MTGLEDSPGDQEIFAWWGGARDIYLCSIDFDDLIGNL